MQVLAFHKYQQEYVHSIIPTALLRYVAIFQARFQSPEMSELCSVGGNNTRTTSGLSTLMMEQSEKLVDMCCAVYGASHSF